MLKILQKVVKSFAVIMFLLFACHQGKVFAGEFTVFAAASTTGPIIKIVEKYQNEKKVKIKTSFASSGMLIKQIENGAQADIYISASKKWADYAEDNKLIIPESRKNFLGNTLVFIIPKGEDKVKISFISDNKFAKEFSGRISIGNPEHVPAGKYAKESLMALNWWGELKDKFILSKSVRGALRVVESAEAEYGIVYGSDAAKSEKVEVTGVFPDDLHKPIVYVIACVVNCSQESYDFVDYICSSSAQEIFQEYGFKVLK